MNGQQDAAERDLDRIYRAAAAPQYWPLFLDGLRRELRAASVHLILRHPAEDDPGVDVSLGVDERLAEAYRLHFYRSNPWRPWGAAAEEGRTVLGDSIVPEGEQVRTEFYNDWMRPQGFAHPFAAFLHKPDWEEPLSSFAGFREKHGGPFEKEDLDRIRLLVPHLQRALVIHTRVQGAEACAGAAEEALDRINGGVILIDEWGAPIVTNRNADRILAANDGLVLDWDGPSAATPQQTGVLRRLLSEAATTGNGKGAGAGGVMRLARPSGRPALEVVVTPLCRESSPMFTATATAAIFVADPDDRAERPPERLRRFYGLTRKEAELASRLARGMSLSEISDALGVTIHTVRGHLKQLFAKTGTHRQAELVRVLLAGLADIRLE